MRDLIREFVIDSGYEVFELVPMLYGKADFVGYNDSEFIVIESKISKWKNAIKQILRYGYGADQQYIAMPLKTANHIYNNYSMIFSKYKIGLLAVDFDSVEVLMKYNNDYCSPIVKRNMMNLVQNRINKRNKRMSEFKQRFEL